MAGDTPIDAARLGRKLGVGNWRATRGAAPGHDEPISGFGAKRAATSGRSNPMKTWVIVCSTAGRPNPRTHRESRRSCPSHCSHHFRGVRASSSVASGFVWADESRTQRSTDLGLPGSQVLAIPYDPRSSVDCVVRVAVRRHGDHRHDCHSPAAYEPLL